MISRSVKDLDYIPLNDEVGLTGIICPKCGRRIPLLEIFSFDATEGYNKQGIPVLRDHVDTEEVYECDCGEVFTVYLDCKYAIGPAPIIKEMGRFQEETIVPLHAEDEMKIVLPEK